jgi:hypothetical protein
MFDFNTAEKQQSGGLIPKGAIVPVIMNLRRGGESYDGMGPNDGGLFKATNAGDAFMLDVEYTVTAGEYKGRKIWEMICAKGNGSKGHNTWQDIARTKLRAIIESSRNIDPDDGSEAAMKARQINGYIELDGVEFCARVGVEKDEEYGDKNKLTAVTPNDKAYLKPGEAPAPKAAASTQEEEPKAKPSWAA